MRLLNMNRYNSHFPNLLTGGIDFETIEGSDHSIYAMDQELNLIYYNKAWKKFALDNGGQAFLNQLELGQNVIDYISGYDLKNFYGGNFEQVLKSGKSWYHEYECSSITAYRSFFQTTYRLKNSKGLAVISSLSLELPMEKLYRIPCEAKENHYFQKSGFINQCSNCRFTKRADHSQKWEWVPQWINNIPKNINHSLCPNCQGYFDYYGKYGSIRYSKLS